jgi:hypothetical protein
MTHSGHDPINLLLSRIDPEDCGSLLEGAELVLYHYIEGPLGGAELGEKPVEITAGKVVIFPQNHEHLLGSSLDCHRCRHAVNHLTRLAR